MDAFRIPCAEWRWTIAVALGLLFAGSLPYLIAWAVAPPGHLFTGLLVNPLDGHSYIAKMRQGLEGSWRFHLAFTPETHPGAYLFLAHIALGHLARWAGLSLVAIYHGARVVAGAVLLLVLYPFIAMLEQPVKHRRMAFLLASTSAGLGWLVAPLTGHPSPDLWIPEAFTFYSLLANFHFPLSIALMMVVMMTLAWPGREPRLREGLVAMLASVALGVLQPFAVIPVYATLALRLALKLRPRIGIPWQSIGWTAGAALVALAYPLYGVWAIHFDPVLAAWNAQNRTPSPPLWDWLLGLGLPVCLALPGLVATVRRRSVEYWLPLFWVLAAVIGMYMPLALQRRLSLGLQIPVALLATRGWWEVVCPRLHSRLRPVGEIAVIGFSAVGNLFLVGMLLMGAVGGEPLFYVSKAEWRAFAWLQEVGKDSEVVLCAPTTGMLIPAWSGRRVVYGHPFETVDAQRREAQVTAFWSGAMSYAEQKRFLHENDVRYLFVGPRERALGDVKVGAGFHLRFQAGDVAIYEVEGR
ncbi:MAG: hypothetical protein N2508_01225 [Anaerolineae bacterium]|nr:hypothetical protein [Anaerolineae bacterium]